VNGTKTAVDGRDSTANGWETAVDGAQTAASGLDARANGGDTRGFGGKARVKAVWTGLTGFAGFRSGFRQN